MAKFRGIQRPKVEGRGSSWVINDGGFGYFTGMTREHVVEQWEDKVKESLERDALDEGDYQFTHAIGDWTCGKCGGRIADPWIHNDWHVRLEG